MAYLVVTMKDKELCRRELSGPGITVGRSTDCDLWLNDGGVSRRHCCFERNGEAWEVVDLGSRNGVVVHGEKVTRHVLRDGDSVHVGGARIAFHAVGYVPSRPTRPATPQPVGDSISDTIVSANSGSRMGRALPTPRAVDPDAREKVGETSAPLAFTRPPARPIPAPSQSPDDNVKSKGEHPIREGVLRRFLHK
ncbi:MAG TPA: FHA domain-containing protein [Tepidisphaeraceae bacterium]|nr:FHA domain-containing protein [Tepidisphaeraceae bacterium]